MEGLVALRRARLGERTFDGVGRFRDVNANAKGKNVGISIRSEYLYSMRVTVLLMPLVSESGGVQSSYGPAIQRIVFRYCSGGEDKYRNKRSNHTSRTISLTVHIVWGSTATFKKHLT